MKRKTPLRSFSQLKPSPLLRKTGFSRSSTFNKKQGRKRINPVSEKRKKERPEYSRLSKEFLREHPWCEGCEWEFFFGAGGHQIRPSTEIQHKALRGKFYLRTDTWAAVCREHGERCTTDPKWAYESGLRLTREQIRKLQ